jgi:hypothetical protein
MIVAWLPGGLSFLLGSLDFPAPVGLGLLLLVCGSAGAAFSAVQTIRAAVSGADRRFGRYAWKLWLSVLLWFAWLPVPARMSLVYWLERHY